MAPVFNKRWSISLEMKLRILESVDKHQIPKTEIAKLYNIPKSTLFTIIKNRDAIIKAKESNGPRNRLHNKMAKYPLLEKALIEWVKSMRSNNMPVNGIVLKAKAQAFAKEFNVNNEFKASDGWLQNFKMRNGLIFKELCGESSSVDFETVTQWRYTTMEKLINEYNEEDIFNADETALFYKLLPEKSLVFKDEIYSGGKRAKQRLTILLAANMSGTEKLPLLVIGNSQKLHCFKGIKTLPVIYKANRKAWMTSEIFEEWVKNLDKKMKNEGRNILLIIDNCAAHPPEIKNLEAVKMEFLPPNVTSALQPMNQGVIKCFKRNYRKKLVNEILISLEANKSHTMNVLQAIHIANAAWQAVSQDTISNCFRHAGFSKKQAFETEPSVEGSRKLSTETEDFDYLMQALRKHVLLPENLTFEDYVAVDDNLETEEEFSEDGLIRSFLNPDQDISNISSDEEIDEVPETPSTLKEAKDAIKILRNFFGREENSHDYFQMINSLESGILEFSSRRLKQKSILFFQKC